jgi:cytochrome b6-f complex iron-sulfur subunit
VAKHGTVQNRRQFLVNLWKAGGALLIGAAGYTAYEALRPLASGAGGGKLRLGPAKGFAEGTVTEYPEGRLFLANAKGTYLALSQKCPHLGCKVQFCESSGWFECPCHGSVFDLGGEWITGPSPTGMNRYQTDVVAGTVVVDTGALQTGPPHGAKKYFSPKKGPSCTDAKGA